jgi:hypothetical protein
MHAQTTAPDKRFSRRCLFGVDESTGCWTWEGWYELQNGSQSTGVEPYEYDAEDFEEIATTRAMGALDEHKVGWTDA